MFHWEFSLPKLPFLHIVYQIPYLSYFRTCLGLMEEYFDKTRVRIISHCLLLIESYLANLLAGITAKSCLIFNLKKWVHIWTLILLILFDVHYLGRKKHHFLTLRLFLSDIWKGYGKQNTFFKLRGVINYQKPEINMFLHLN